MDPLQVLAFDHNTAEECTADDSWAAVIEEPVEPLDLVTESIFPLLLNRGKTIPICHVKTCHIEEVSETETNGLQILEVFHTFTNGKFLHATIAEISDVLGMLFGESGHHRS